MYIYNYIYIFIYDCIFYAYICVIHICGFTNICDICVMYIHVLVHICISRYILLWCDMKCTVHDCVFI